MARKGDRNRTSKTYKHKLSKLKRIYNNLYKASEKAKKKGITRRFYFHEKYITFEKYQKTFKLKEPK